MPYAAPSRCLVTGCAAWAYKRGRCEEHYTPWEQRSANSKALTGRERASIRRGQLAREPDCRVCGAPATDADHILPISEGGARFDPANLQSLCGAHHDEKTRREAAERNRRRAGRM